MTVMVVREPAGKIVLQSSGTKKRFGFVPKFLD